MSQDAKRSDDAHLDVVLYAHRSLPPRNFVFIMAVVAGVGALFGIAFAVHGAWLVLPFFGCEILLIYFAFRLSYRAARGYEAIRLTDDALTVEQVAPTGARRHHEFRPPHWLQVELSGEAAGKRHLRLLSHGRRLEIGAFLSRAEKVAFTDVLRGALAKLGPVPTGA